MNGRAYYNEIDPYAAQWLRNLIAAGLIAPGEVDGRSIADVQPSDLAGYSQCHFYDGIGGWSRALRLAGWPDDQPVWTFSEPCQPYSEAGLRRGLADERALRPHTDRLVRECRPAILFGEQVARADGVVWLDRAAQDFEAQGYAFAAAVLPACSVGAGHRRDRFFVVAHAVGTDAGGRLADRGWVTSPQNLARPWAYAGWQGGADCDGVVADGVSARVAKSIAGGFGNAIVPKLGAEFIIAATEAMSEAA